MSTSHELRRRLAHGLRLGAAGVAGSGTSAVLAGAWVVTGAGVWERFQTSKVSRMPTKTNSTTAEPDSSLHPFLRNSLSRARIMSLRNSPRVRWLDQRPYRELARR